MTSRTSIICLIATAGLMTACVGPGYYLQAAGGQLQMMSNTRTIDEILSDPASPVGLKSRLATAQQARDFASHELGLPDNRSYRGYTDIKRRHVVWNVYATPALTLEPLKWCFPVAGCVAYRGYFAQEDAERLARRLRKKGYDVHVAGVDAYSTLGWFSDPLPSPVLRRSDAEMAGLIFHELAHQQLYIGNDTAFNESFARTVEIEGMRRWLLRPCTGQGCDGTRQATELAGWLQDKSRQDDFVALLKLARDRLQQVYTSGLTDHDKLAAKMGIFSELRSDYLALRSSWGDYSGYDRWFSRDLNNAHLISIDTYHRHVPALRALLEMQSGNLTMFYEAAGQLGRLTRSEREKKLAELSCRIRLTGGDTVTGHRSSGSDCLDGGVN